MLKLEPYFMENKEWYECAYELGYPNGFPEFEDGRGYRLTDKAPQEAIDSYEDFYRVEVDEEGRVSD